MFQIPTEHKRHRMG